MAVSWISLLHRCSNIFWNETGNLVCLATDDCYFILNVDTATIQTAVDAKQGLGEDGLEEAFDVLSEVHEQVKTGLWVGDCFIYTNSVNRINYYVGGEIVTISHLDRTMYLLGYVAKDNRLYLGDKELNVTSFSLLLSVLEYQTAVMRSDFDTADRVLPTIPKEHRTRVAHFLEKQGFKPQALLVSTDPEHRFELALQIGDLPVALELARDSENPHKWSQLAEVATAQNDFALVRDCLQRANDHGGQLLVATAAGDADAIRALGAASGEQGKHNIAFLSAFLLGDTDRCLQILVETSRLPEAAFFARTYMPARVPEVVALWRQQLAKVNEKAGQSLADPAAYENLFPGLQDTLKAEQFLAKQRVAHRATDAKQIPLNIDRAPVAEMRAAEASGAFDYEPQYRVPATATDAETPLVAFGGASTTIPTVPQATQATSGGSSSSTEEDGAANKAPPAVLKRKNSLDDFELEIEGINLDENIDTSVGFGRRGQ